jgi:hypothetical protein
MQVGYGLSRGHGLVGGAIDNTGKRVSYTCNLCDRQCSREELDGSSGRHRESHSLEACDSNWRCRSRDCPSRRDTNWLR